MPTSTPLPSHPRDAEPLPTDGALAELLNARGFTVRDYREACRCIECGHCSYDPDTGQHDDVTTSCAHGCCVVFRCAACGHYDSGAGPAGCGCDDGI